MCSKSELIIQCNSSWLNLIIPKFVVSLLIASLGSEICDKMRLPAVFEKSKKKILISYKAIVWFVKVSADPSKRRPEKHNKDVLYVFCEPPT